MSVADTSPRTTLESSCLLVYDGDCGFCTEVAERFRPHLPSNARAIPWQELPSLAAYGLQKEDVTSASYWIENGKTYRGADGIARTLQACGGISAVLGISIRVFPVNMAARAVYFWVARNRDKFPGSTQACQRPSANEISSEDPQTK